MTDLDQGGADENVEPPPAPPAPAPPPPPLPPPWVSETQQGLGTPPPVPPPPPNAPPRPEPGPPRDESTPNGKAGGRGGQWGPPPPSANGSPTPPASPAPPAPPSRPGQWGPGAPPVTPFTADQPRDAAHWNGTGRQPVSAPPAPPGGQDYYYADSIRSSELIRTRKAVPARGWRKLVLTASFGLINLGQSPDERRQAELEAKIRSLLRGRYKIGVLGKGGTGKTTIAASVGSILARLRQEDRVVAIDADTSFGKLGLRVDPTVSGSYWELAGDQHLHTFADVRSRVGSNTAGLFVLPGERAVARRRVLDPAVYREAATRLDNHFTISLIDCGASMDSPVTREVLLDLDALIVVSSPWLDAASAAAQTMDWLAGNGYTGLLHRTVVVINDADGHARKANLDALAEDFGRSGQTVVALPYDAHLRPGGVIDVEADLDARTRRKFAEIAAALAEHFPATTDGPRDRR